MGGNVDLVKWLVEKEDCPLSVRQDPKSGIHYSVQTSARRTLIDLAMRGRPKIEILSFLIQKNLSVLDTKDPRLAPKTLQTLLGAGFRFEKKDGREVESFSLVESSDQMSVATLDDAVSSSDICCCCLGSLRAHIRNLSSLPCMLFSFLHYLVYHLL